MKARRDSEERYRTLFESMSEGFLVGELILDGDGRPADLVVLDANPACERYFGLPPGQMLGRTASEIARPVRPIWLERLGQVVRAGLPVRFEDHSATLDGWFEVYAFSLHNGSQFAVIFSDITKRKRAEEALQKSEEKYRFLVENSKDITWKIDLQGRWTFISGNAEKVTGYRADESVGKSIGDFLAPESYELVNEKLRRRLLGEEIPPYEVLIRNRDGHYTPFELLTASIVDDGGKIVGVQGIGRDISYRKEAEEALRNSEAKFRALFENAGAAIYIIDVETGAIVDCNSNAERLVGRTRDELMGMVVMLLHPPDDVESHRGNFVGRAGQGHIVNYEGEALHRDGRRIPVIINAAPISIGGRKVMMGVFLDITERKRAEEALRENEEMFRALAETASVAICILQDGQFQYVNPAMEVVSGYTRDELLTIDFTDLVHPDRLEYVKERYGSWLIGASGEARGELKGTGKDGEVRWADISRKTISYRGRPAILLTGIDITERKRAEEALRESEERFRVLAETSPTAICVFRGEEFVYINPAIEQISGYGKEEMMKMKMWDLLTPGCRNLLKERAEARKRGNPVPSRYELSFVNKNREVRWVDVSLGPVNIGGAPAYIVSAFDITERKRADKELLDAKAQAELYLDLMGHDINNMHQVALGYLEIAMNMQTDEGQKALLAKPVEALQRSALLIRNVRKLQKLRDGGFDSRTINLCTLLADLQSEYEALPDRAVSLDLNGHTFCFVRANELLYDVFANLVSNAIKHNAGSPRVVVSLDSVKEDGQTFYRVSVEDNGPGITDDFKARVFKRMLRGTSKANGMGLGLYLVKSLVDSYHGRVWVEDRVPGDYKRGAKFVVQLPAVE